MEAASRRDGVSAQDCIANCVGLARIEAKLANMHETLADLRDAVRAQNGRVRDLEIAAGRADASLGTLAKTASIIVGCLGVGAAIAKLFL